MADKPKLNYRVVTGKNPRTSEVQLRPVITGRETYYIDQVINYALNAGYIRGQFEDMKGVVNGFVSACKQLGEEGKAVNIANWFRIHGELKGTVGEDRQLTSDNAIKVAITALTELKQSIDAFSWTNVDDSGVICKIENLLSVGGTPGYIAKDLGIVATGKNLMFSAALGDKTEVAWLDEESGESKTLSLTPTESDYAHQAYAWPTGLASVADGTKLTFTFTLHGGVEGGATQTITKVVTFKAA